jgi:hypothetical protein
MMMFRLGARGALNQARAILQAITAPMERAAATAGTYAISSGSNGALCSSLKKKISVGHRTDRSHEAR